MFYVKSHTSLQAVGKFLSHEKNINKKEFMFDINSCDTLSNEKLILQKKKENEKKK